MKNHVVHVKDMLSGKSCDDIRKTLYDYVAGCDAYELAADCEVDPDLEDDALWDAIVDEMLLGIDDYMIYQISDSTFYNAIMLYNKEKLGITDAYIAIQSYSQQEVGFMFMCEKDSFGIHDVFFSRLGIDDFNVWAYNTFGFAFAFIEE